MPVYIILTKEKLIDEQMQKISKKITEIHFRVTGTPLEYITATFMSGYQLKNQNKLTLLGNIRIGGNRTSITIEKLKSELINGIAAALKLDSSKIGIDFLGIKAHWVSKGNEVLTEPGQENHLIINKKIKTI
ncbi:hypothetical protein GTQ40_00770 [Flavobacteriaceae bacterium R38]|nr:hypothetical protein [Flavobacteriaceae bacterium R38]